MKRIRLYVFLYFTAIVLLEFAYRSLDRVARGYSSDWQTVLIEQATGVYGVALLLPLIFWTVRKFPPRWAVVPLACHLLSLTVLSILHTSWNWGTRLMLCALFGMGTYDYGHMVVRYFMEFPSDVVAYTIAVAIYSTYRNWLRNQNLETELVTARLDNLTRQLQPHFLFNALNAISSVMYEDVQRADKMLEGLADFLRATTRLPESPILPVADELKLVSQYLDVMKMRLEHRLEFAISCDPDAAIAQCPPLLLQPIVENAVEHGQDSHSGQVRICIQVTRVDNLIQFSIRDHGAGPTKTIPHTGQGILNTQRRLTTVYRGAASFRLIHHPDGGALAELTIPA